MESVSLFDQSASGTAGPGPAGGHPVSQEETRDAPSFTTPLYIYITVSVFYGLIFLLGIVGKNIFIISLEKAQKGCALGSMSRLPMGQMLFSWSGNRLLFLLWYV